MACDPTKPCLNLRDLANALDNAELRLFGARLIFTVGSRGPVTGGPDEYREFMACHFARWEKETSALPHLDFAQLSSNVHGFVENVEWMAFEGKLAINVPPAVIDREFRDRLYMSTSYTKEPVSDRHALVLALGCVQQFAIVSQDVLRGL